MSPQLPSILITGGLGFIGKSLASFLLAKNYPITILDFRPATGEEKMELKGAKFETGDVTDADVWAKLPPAEIICHFAAPSSIISFKTDLNNCVRITLQGLTNAFSWALTTGVKKVIYPSSGSIFGGSNKASDETTQPNPPNTYGQTKLACEAIAAVYAQTVPSLGLRIFAGYGPREAQKGQIASVVTLFLTEMQAGRPPVIYGDGSQTRDFVYIDDVVETIGACLENDLTGVLNVGSGRAVSFNQVVAELNQLLETKIEPAYVARPTSYLDSTLCQPKKMIQVLGREPLSFQAGLKRYFENLSKPGL